MRRFGERVSRGQRYIVRPGVYAVLIRDGAVLITRQTAPRDEFQLPGGGTDPGEQPLRALHREVAEETGWTITAPCRLGAYRRFAFMPEYGIWAEKICAVYLARPLRRFGPPTEPGHSAHLVPVRTALALLGNHGDRHFLALAAGLQPWLSLAPWNSKNTAETSSANSPPV